MLMVNNLCRFYPERAMSLAFVVLNELVEVSLINCLPFSNVFKDSKFRYKIGVDSYIGKKINGRSQTR
jgi:hypothetical protein